MRSFTSHLHSLFHTAVISATLAFSAAADAGTMVRLHTIFGPIDMAMDDTAPITVTNFLAYVRGGDFTSNMIHRSAWLSSNPVTPFVIQGGGFNWPAGGDIAPVTSRGTIPNEYSPLRSNVRGTVAMAKGSTPDSANSQWFVNMRDNSLNLNNQNGGFTVFARVTTPSMRIADRIANLPRANAGQPFAELPVHDWVAGTPVTHDNVMLVSEATEFPAVQSVSDRIFNYLEAGFPQYAVPSKVTTGEALGYQYRYYSGTNVYVGTKDNQVWYQMPAVDNSIRSLGSVDAWFVEAQAAGY